MSSEAKPEAKPAEAPEKKKSGAGGIIALIIPAILSAGAAYGGTRAAVGKGGGGGGGHEEAKPEVHVKAPGPTQNLEPFLLTLKDEAGKAHPMKMTIAIEFDASLHEEPKNLIPRLRDAILSFLRTLTYEQISDQEHFEKIRTEMLEKCRHAGAPLAERILVTDFVIQ